MQKKKWILISVFFLVIVSLTGFFLKDKLSPAQAKLEIKTNVPATVSVDGEQAGQVPLEYYHKPGEVTIRLVPVVSEKPLAPWGTKLTLIEGVTTIVRRDFGETDSDSAGEVLSFEKVGGVDSGISVVSVPDASQVTFDGQPRGFTPLKISQTTSGEHSLVISHPGFLDRTISSLKTVPGYNLVAVVFLAEDKTGKNDAGGSSLTEKKATVEILSTPTGFLRVRQEPTTGSTESARVKPGEKYPFLGQNEAGDWVKIEYESGKVGWVSSQYAKKTDVTP